MTNTSNPSARIAAAVLFGSLLATSQTVSAETLLVPAEYATIGAAIAAAQPGDEVVVADGTYSGPGNYNLSFGGKDIAVRSENGPTNCTIDCQNAGRGFILDSGESRAAIIEGFTITNGTAPSGNGGGIDVALETSPTIRDCVFVNNYALALGGGIALRGQCEALIERCVFVGNQSAGGPEGAQGGGLSCFFLSHATVTDCVFMENQSQWGGALDCSLSNPTVTNCLFVGNQASLGGGAVFVSVADPILVNCTITENLAAAGGGVALVGHYLPSYPTLSNCIISNNTPSEIAVGMGEPTVNHSLVEGGWPGDGNIDADPIFVGLSLTSNPEDYRLASTSPCIDAGDNSAIAPSITTDLGGYERFVDDPDTPDTGVGTPPLVDLGAYEFQPPLLGDLNADGCVDLADLAVLLAEYQCASDCTADLDGDGQVNLNDLAILLASYGLGCG